MGHIGWLTLSCISSFLCRFRVLTDIIWIAFCARQASLDLAASSLRFPAIQGSCIVPITNLSNLHTLFFFPPRHVDCMTVPQMKRDKLANGRVASMHILVAGWLACRCVEVAGVQKRARGIKAQNCIEYSNLAHPNDNDHPKMSTYVHREKTYPGSYCHVQVAR